MSLTRFLNLRKNRIFGCAVAMLASGSLQAQETSQAPMTFHIDTHSMKSALTQFGQQTGLSIMFSKEAVEDLHTPGVIGPYPPEAALKQLLDHTGLVYEFINPHTVAITAGKQNVSSRGQIRLGLADGSSDAAAARVEADTVAAEPDPVSQQESQENSKTSESLQEVVVTAQKRAERLIDVPISIVAISGDQLRQRQITSVEDLGSVVPDLAIERTGNNYYFEIRGVDNTAGNAALVGMYIDEADVTLGGGGSYAAINPVVYDLDRVEVLRGPQGTLYGDGSAGGTIRLITKNPNLERYAFDADVAALFTQHGDPSQRVNAMVNIPLITDQLGLRIVGTLEHDGGWIDQPAANQSAVNWQDLTNVRIKGLWRPNSRLTVSAMAIINNDDRGADYSDPGAPCCWTQVLNFTATPRLKNNYNLYNLTATYELSPSIQILNSTGYMLTSQPVWNNGLTLPYTAPPYTAVNPLSAQFVPYQNNRDHLFTDELRLSSKGSGPWQWTLGEFYRHYRDFADLPSYYFAQQGPPGSPLPAPYSFGVYTIYKSWSTFGDLNYRFADRLTVGAGIRDFQETQDFTNLYPLVGQSGKFHSVDPRVYAQLKLTSDANIYTSAAKGFRTGGFNSFGQPVYGPESVWTYELGTKMALWQSQISFDADIFLSDYSDYQNYGVDPNFPTSINSNVGRARIKGFEGDLTWRPSSAWSVDVRGDVVDSQFTEIDATQTAYQVGDPIDLAPKYQFTVSGQRNFSLLGKAGFVRLDYNQKGPESYRNRSIGPWFLYYSDTIHMINLNSSLQLQDNLRAGFFVQNLSNDQGFVNPFGVQQLGERSRPRTFGVNFSATFE